jgi:hypothetical protein
MKMRRWKIGQQVELREHTLHAPKGTRGRVMRVIEDTHIIVRWEGSTYDRAYSSPEFVVPIEEDLR